MGAVLYSSRRQADGSMKVNGAVDGVPKVVVVANAPEEFSIEDCLAALGGTYIAPEPEEREVSEPETRPRRRSGKAAEDGESGEGAQE